MSEQERKPLWAICETCGHCWAAAYYPIDLMSISRVLKKCCCPMGCKSKPALAKQDDGRLLEPAAGAREGEER